MSVVDVVVVTYNSRDHIRSCIEPIAFDPQIRVVVVDNDSPDEALEAIDDLPVLAIQRHDNRGFGFACNIGWRAGDSSTVVFLNPDATVSAEMILAFADRFERDSSLGVVGPRITDEHGRLYLSQRRFASFPTSIAAALFVPRIRPSTRWSLDVADENAYGALGSPEWISGACLGVRRAALESIGGFDERFFMYYEDMDLCRRIRAAGYGVRYDPTIHAVHVGGASAPRAQLIPVMTRSRLLYARKHGGKRGEAGERAAAALHALTHLALTTQGASARRGYLSALAVSLSGVRDDADPVSPPG